jgi:CheY-like chemotaxis protein
MLDDVVLLVEDDGDARDLLSMLLEEFVGVRVIQASNGLEALERVRKARPALVMLDIVLPDLDGRDVLRQLKADPATQAIPVVAISGMPDACAGAMQLGCADFVFKPFELDHFLATVQRHLPLHEGEPSVRLGAV